jgi:hypothetical protein
MPTTTAIQTTIAQIDEYLHDAYNEADEARGYIDDVENNASYAAAGASRARDLVESVQEQVRNLQEQLQDEPTTPPFPNPCVIMSGNLTGGFTATGPYDLPDALNILAGSDVIINLTAPPTRSE